jgi:cytochrome c-type biogenesis protein CcmE
MDVVSDDVASSDEVGDGLDLSPRPSPGAGGARRRAWPWIAALVVLVGGIGFVISRALTEATQFYLRTDEAVARQAELGTRPFRLEGTVVEGSVRGTDAGGVHFAVTANGAKAFVTYDGAPPQLFQDCIPVVVEGHFQGSSDPGAFIGTSIIVAHDPTYEERNGQRIQEAREQGGSQAGACLARKAATAP